jgi:hypothetical protein
VGISDDDEVLKGLSTLIGVTGSQEPLQKLMGVARKTRRCFRKPRRCCSKLWMWQQARWFAISQRILQEDKKVLQYSYGCSKKAGRCCSRLGDV